MDQLCRLLEISSSGYYAWLHRGISPRKQQDQRLSRQLITLHQQQPASGLDTLFHPEENGLLQKADLSADAAAAHPVRAQIRIQAHHQLQAFPSCCVESFEPEFSGFQAKYCLGW